MLSLPVSIFDFLGCFSLRAAIEREGSDQCVGAGSKRNLRAWVCDFAPHISKGDGLVEVWREAGACDFADFFPSCEELFANSGQLQGF